MTLTAPAAPLGASRRQAASIVSSFSGPILARAAADSFRKLDPRKLLGNPVILATEVVAVLATISVIFAIQRGVDVPFAIQIAAWLWATVFFANFAESIAEGLSLIHI